MKCPCKDCICIPICRHKPLDKLLRGCVLLTNYFVKHISPIGETEKRIKVRQVVIDTIKPSQWNMDSDGYFTPNMIQRKRGTRIG